MTGHRHHMNVTLKHRIHEERSLAGTCSVYEVKSGEAECKPGAQHNPYLANQTKHFTWRADSGNAGRQGAPPGRDARSGGVSEGLRGPGAAQLPGAPLLSSVHPGIPPFTPTHRCSPLSPGVPGQVVPFSLCLSFFLGSAENEMGPGSGMSARWGRACRCGWGCSCSRSPDFLGAFWVPYF